MGKNLSEALAKAQPIELDRPRKLMLTNYAWDYLEATYDSMPGALRAFAEMNAGYRAFTHAKNWLWALLQEEARQDNKGRRMSEQEELTVEDVELMLEPAELEYYKGKIADTITAYYPIPDPLKPALGIKASPGTGGGFSNSSGVNSSGAATSS